MKKSLPAAILGACLVMASVLRAGAATTEPTLLRAKALRVPYNHKCGTDQMENAPKGATPVVATVQGTPPGQWVQGAAFKPNTGTIPGAGTIRVCLNVPADVGISVTGSHVGVWVNCLLVKSG